MTEANALTEPFLYSAADVELLLDHEPELLQTLFAQFTDRTLHIKQLGIDRNTFINWEKGGLIPYEREESGGWRKFSFVEAVWVKTVEEMRALGLSLDTIREVKERLWPRDTAALRDYLLSQLSGFTNGALRADERLALAADLKATGEAELKRLVDEEQFCFLLLFVAGAVLHKTDYCLLITKDKSIALFPLYGRRDGSNANPGWQEKLQETLFYSSYTLINLWSVIQELALGEAAHLKREVLLQMVSPTEQTILELVREKRYTEILVTKDGGGEPSHVKVTRRGVDEEVIKKLHRYLKRGTYQSIAFKTRDGQLIHFEETDVIKLNKPRPEQKTPANKMDDKKKGNGASKTEHRKAAPPSKT